jgi:AmiR/NasT family two-component response regulator
LPVVHGRGLVVFFRPERTCVPPNNTAAKPLRLVIAEDETIIRMDLQTLLERAGHDVVGAAKDGEEAVALAAEHEPDLVVLDVRMPRLGGIEAARRIVAERPVPVVMLSAYGQEEHVRAAAGAGSFGYVVKPFREEDLSAAITTARERFRELASARAEAAALAGALDERLVVRRAQSVLMQVDGVDEHVARARLEDAGRRSGRPVAAVAEAVVSLLGDG